MMIWDGHRGRACCLYFGMPRKARIDAADAIHHVIVRGIERRKIFWDQADI